MRGHTTSDGRTVMVTTDGHPGYSARIRALDDTDLVTHGDLAHAVLLLPAMRSGRDLELDAAVSSRRLDQGERIQDVLLTWDRFLRPRHRWYRRVRVTAPVPEEPLARAPGTLCLFTGGVDSFHTVITERHRIDALLYIHGFDVDLDDEPLRRQVGDHLRRAAEGLDLPLVELESDLRDAGHGVHVGWDDHHGAALVATASSLTHRFGHLLVPATHTYAHLEGLGSHPLLDPLWSGDRLTVEHVGAQHTRVDKIRALADEPVAREHLRVCWENRDGRYNCGRCEKCVRTGVAVRLAGAEGRFPTINAPSLRDVASTRITGRGSPWEELHNELLAQGGAARLRRAVEFARLRHRRSRSRTLRRRLR